MERVTLVLPYRPDETKAEEIADAVVGRYRPDAVRYGWEIRDVLPHGLNIAAADQLMAQRRDYLAESDLGACYFVVMLYTDVSAVR